MTSSAIGKKRFTIDQPDKSNAIGSYQSGILLLVQKINNPIEAATVAFPSVKALAPTESEVVAFPSVKALAPTESEVVALV